MKLKNKLPFFILFLLLCTLWGAQALGDTMAFTPAAFTLPLQDSQAKRLCDGDYKTYWESSKNDPYMDIDAPQPLGGIYLCFAFEPGPWVAQTNQAGQWVTLYKGGKEGFLHEYFPLEGQQSIRIKMEQSGQKLQLCEVFLLDQGPLPSFVQQWTPTKTKADMLLLTAHPDDEVIFFGGLLPYYSGELKKDIVVAVMTTGARVRKHELLNSLWLCGHENYPVMGPFKDEYFNNLKEAYALWGKKRSHQYITSLIRQYRPDVIVTHDKKGEYGHGAHRLCADGVTLCIDKAADATVYNESAQLYGIWQVKKAYLHLGKEQTVTLNWDLPLKAFGGQTGFEVAQQAYKEHLSQQNTRFAVEGRGDKHSSYYFSLIHSTVGIDTDGEDFFESLPLVQH